MPNNGIPMPVSDQRLGKVVGGEDAGAVTTQVTPGCLLSLNMKKCAFLAAPDGSFVMNIGNPTARIPYDAGEDVLHALQNEVRLGKIIIGDSPVKPEPQQGLIQPFLDAVSAAENPDDLMPTCKSASVTNRSGITPTMIFEAMIKHESEGACRTDIINLLSEFIRLVGGAGTVEENPADEVQVTLPIGANGSVQMPRTAEQSETLKDLI